jgi:hypothetical protein
LSFFSEEARSDGFCELDGVPEESVAGAEESVLVEEGALPEEEAEEVLEPPAEEGAVPPEPPAAPIVPVEAHAASDNPVSASSPGITLARSRTVMIHPLWKAFTKPRLARGCRTI